MILQKNYLALALLFTTLTVQCENTGTLCEEPTKTVDQQEATERFMQGFGAGLTLMVPNRVTHFAQRSLNNLKYAGHSAYNKFENREETIATIKSNSAKTWEAAQQNPAYYTGKASGIVVITYGWYRLTKCTLKLAKRFMV